MTSRSKPAGEPEIIRWRVQWVYGGEHKKTNQYPPPKKFDLEVHTKAGRIVWSSGPPGGMFHGQSLQNLCRWAKAKAVKIEEVNDNNEGE